ncbi:hypothetical protein DFR29_105106 [Tahibacter aquaticus]|jgi:hypothetical protein|uniref:Uncharacterized protein n=1 Tax=Tahibacter aquaticus TaxID=520092 RepID=A0A4R6Z073_9GAMM|nr:hypothetical protein DFR29_105106 [Tahibacter aquaticus]
MLPVCATRGVLRFGERGDGSGKAATSYRAALRYKGSDYFQSAASGYLPYAYPYPSR